MLNELSVLRSLFSGDYIPLVVLSGLFVALLFRREAIISPALFRIGYLFVIAAILVPALIAPFTMSGLSRPYGSSMGESSGLMTIGLLNAIGPVLMAIGLLCVFGSLMPPLFHKPTNLPPQKHPLD